MTTERRNVILEIGNPYHCYSARKKKKKSFKIPRLCLEVLSWGEMFEVVKKLKYIGVQISNTLDW